MRPLARLGLVVSTLAAGTSAALAQCAHQWSAGYAYPGVAGSVAAMVHWDPDGSGPLPTYVVLGGYFTHAGTVDASGLAAWDPNTGAWLQLPAPPLGGVSALAVAANGDLVVAAHDTFAQVARIATWNGTSWTLLGPVFQQATYAPSVRALHVRPSGELVASGSFTVAGGGPVLGAVITWNGAAWAPLGGGVSDEVAALATMPNGDLLAGGSVTSAGGIPVNHVARWNGTAWSAMGAGTTAEVRALAPVAANRVFAGTRTQLAEWNGVAWNTVPGLVGPAVLPLEVAALTTVSGRLVAAGTIFTAGGAAAGGVAALDLATGAWSPIGGFNPFELMWPSAVLLGLANGEFLLGGFQFGPGSLQFGRVARWDGAGWRALADGPMAAWCVADLGGGAFAIGGNFANLGNVVAANVAQWNGAQWQPLGSGLGGPGDWVTDLEVLSNGDLVASGSFQTAGTAPARALARWDGSAWSELGGATGSGGALAHVDAMTSLPNGDLVVGGTFVAVGGVPASHVARWNGAQWLSLGAGLAADVLSLAPAGGDTLVAVAVDGSVSRWDGAAWSTLTWYGWQDAPFLAGAIADGTIVVAFGRQLSTSQWLILLDVIPPFAWPTRFELGRGSITGMVSLPDGSLLVSGFVGYSATPLTNPLPANVVRVQPGGVVTPLGVGAGIADACLLPDGELLAVGTFVDPGPAITVGRLRSTCPAITAASGAGCTGSAGPNVLAATALPWIGSTYVARATGMPANAIAVGARGLGALPAPLPLGAVLPQALTGCTLLVLPDVLDAYVPVGGEVTTQLAIPNAVALVGATFHEQVIALELGAAGIVAATSTNLVTATLGWF